MVKPRAIIFDMDGVIVDSMPYHFIAWYEALRPYGIRVSAFEVYSKEGERWEKTLIDLLESHGVEARRDVLAKVFSLRQKIFRKYFKRFIFKGVDKFLGCLKARGFKLALVTGSPIWEVKRILPVEIRKVFEVVVAGNDLKKGKPHPEPYLRASRMLKLKPRECLVVENAPFGIESAKRAGMACIALTTSLPKEYLRKADFIADKVEDIASIISPSCPIS